MRLEEIREKFGVQTIKHRVYAEDALQMACVRWFDHQYPQYRILLDHSPNEGKLFRNSRDGAKRKAMGVRAGVPDLLFLVANRRFHHMAIEFKTPKGRQTESQKEYQRAFEEEGGKYVVVRSFEEFVTTIKDYIKEK